MSSVEFWVNTVGDETIERFTSGEHDEAVPATRTTLARVIQRAVAEEREACAKIAERVRDGRKEHEGSHAHKCDWDDCCAYEAAEEIAAAIRARRALS